MSTQWRQLGAVQKRVLLRLHGQRSQGALGENAGDSVVGLHRRGLVTVEVLGQDLPLVELNHLVWSNHHGAWLRLKLTEDGEAAVVEGFLRGLRG
jgi:hypothetical protein